MKIKFEWVLKDIDDNDRDSGEFEIEYPFDCSKLENKDEEEINSILYDAFHEEDFINTLEEYILENIGLSYFGFPDYTDIYPVKIECDNITYDDPYELMQSTYKFLFDEDEGEWKLEPIN